MLVIFQNSTQDGHEFKFIGERAKFFFENFVRQDQKNEMEKFTKDCIIFARNSGYSDKEIWIEFKMFSPNQITVSVCTDDGQSSSTPFYCDIEPGFFKDRTHNKNCKHLETLPFNP